jgi:hypothetical protein
LIRTDHAALTFLHKFAGNNIRLLRWSLKLAEYDFRVEYRAGSKIPHCDALSRHFCAAAALPEVQKDQLGREQEADQYCRSLKIGDAQSKSEFFKDEDGVVYRRGEKGTPLLVVPQSMVTNILKLNHDSIYASHPGRQRMLDILKARF